MPMLQLKSQKICDEFKVNKKLYSNRISDSQVRMLEYIEEQITSRSTAFLTDPGYWIMQWEEITGDDMPLRYTRDLPRQITGTAAKVSRKSKTLYFFEYLPVINDRGVKIDYPRDRQVFENKKVYIIDDKLVKELAVVA